MTLILYRFLFFFNKKAHQQEQDPIHTSDDATEAALDVARPLDVASIRNCPQNTYLLYQK